MTKFREARSRSSGGRAPSGEGETERPAKTKSWGVVGRGEFAAKQRKKRQAAKPQPELGHSPAKGRTWANEKEPNPSIRLPAIRSPMLAFQRCCARGHRGEQHVPLPQEFSSRAASNLDYCSARRRRVNRKKLRGGNRSSALICSNPDGTRTSGQGWGFYKRKRRTGRGAEVAPQTRQTRRRTSEFNRGIHG